MLVGVYSAFCFHVYGQHPHHPPDSHDKEMPSSFSVGTMMRQGSGTSWIPESSPMYAWMRESGGWMTMFHPLAFATFSRQSGPRGASEFFGTNSVMVSAQRRVGGLTRAGRGTLLLRGMFSLDALTSGNDGYPLLFQTGETYNQLPLVDRQHPHDFFMETAVAYSAPVTRSTSLSVYFAPMGEPALGPAMFSHRISAIDNPEAPIGHHWQDSTHIASGVITLGVAQDKWKIEGSIFTGREPDERRWNFERPRFDSWSMRLSVNPHRNVSGQISYGRLREPEKLEPGIEIRKITAAAIYHQPLGDRSHISTSFVWGRNLKSGGFLARSYSTHALLAEAAVSIRESVSFFGRLERVGKDELFAVGEHLHDPLIFPVQRYTAGGVWNLPMQGPIVYGLGASFSFHSFPTVLKLYYGDRPMAAAVFLRVRLKSNNTTSRQKSEMTEQTK